MKQIILPSIVLEFTWLVIDGFMEENAPSPKKEIRTPQYIFVGMGSIYQYTMENNDTNTDYHKFVRVGDQKLEVVEITI